jgi:hypothetical protein
MPADFQFLYWDLIVATSITITMVWTDSSTELSIKRPESSLLSARNLVTVFSQDLF